MRIGGVSEHLGPDPACAVAGNVHDLDWHVEDPGLLQRRGQGARDAIQAAARCVSG